MVFNSVAFSLFLVVVFFTFWANKESLKRQNLIILCASYFFYGCWDYRFLSLIIFSTLVDYYIGIKIHDAQIKKHKKILLATTIFVNLGLLISLKYFNFFLDNLNFFLTKIGFETLFNSLEIVLPVGISFYTFQTMSYSIDIYRGKIKPSRDIIAFGSFVSFFPQLVAGPIERASNLLPQFHKKKSFSLEKSIDGLKQILWGLVKKVLIADNCAQYANYLFENNGIYNGLSLLFGAIMFSFQIYGDFSGYSDIAIGTSRLFGFELKRNFNFPYFSRNISEFWRKWHISLSTWFRDYLYIPLGGSQKSLGISIRNVFIIFLVSGFWHGANWTFIFWGGFHALLFLPSLLLKNNRKFMGDISIGKNTPSIKELFQIIKTFFFVSIGWVFFRAENIFHAFNYLKGIAIGLFQKSSYINFLNFLYWKVEFSILLFSAIFIFLEWLGRNNEYGIQTLFSKNKLARRLSYLVILVIIFWFGGKQEEFIYFQF